MAKVTSKLQVTLPKRLAEAYGIRPGDEVEWVAAGEAIRVWPARARRRSALDTEARLRLFDQATERQRARDAARACTRPAGRGWTRDELYVRDEPDRRGGAG